MPIVQEKSRKPSDPNNWNLVAVYGFMGKPQSHLRELHNSKLSHINANEFNYIQIAGSHHITFPTPWCSGPLLRCFDATWQQSLAETLPTRSKFMDQSWSSTSTAINENIAYNYGIVGESWDNDFQLVYPNTIIYIYIIEHHFTIWICTRGHSLT